MLHLHWFLPTHGDGREVAKAVGDGTPTQRATRRDPDLGYLAGVAGAADQLGFEGVLTPAGLFCEDAWLVTSALAQVTRQLRFMIALRPGLISPTLMAQMAATFQRLSGDRLLLNVVIGGDADEQRRYGDWLPHDQRYERADEYLTVVRRILAGETVDFTGRYIQVAGATVARPPAVPPTLFLGGSSASAQRVAAKHVDVYLAWGERPPDLVPLANRVRELAGDRPIEVGTRYHVITRDTAAEAWAEADKLLTGMPAHRVAAAQTRFAKSESEGQRRMSAMHGGVAGRLEVYPNVWAGYAMVRPGAGAALVGSHEQVAERIEELHALGMTHLILSGQPHLEEAYWFGEGVMPLLRARGLLAPARREPELAGAR